MQPVFLSSRREDSRYNLRFSGSLPGEVYQLNNLPKAKKDFPRLSEVPSQVLQQALKQLHVGWKYFQERGFGFPRFKKYGQFKSLLFPQFKENPVTNLHIKLPRLELSQSTCTVLSPVDLR